MTVRYVGGELLWGDRVHVLSQTGSRWKVKARGWTDYVKAKDLEGESLLEVQKTGSENNYPYIK